MPCSAAKPQSQPARCEVLMDKQQCVSLKCLEICASWLGPASETHSGLRLLLLRADGRAAVHQGQYDDCIPSQRPLASVQTTALTHRDCQVCASCSPEANSLSVIERLLWKQQRSGHCRGIGTRPLIREILTPRANTTALPVCDTAGRFTKRPQTLPEPLHGLPTGRPHRKNPGDPSVHRLSYVPLR
jgi:hypothetical protein